jgi:hypothetical protein
MTQPRKTKNKTGQISVDLIIVLAIVFVIFIIILTTVYSRDDSFISQRTKYYASTLCNKIALNVNTVFLSGEGINKTIFIPLKLKDGTNYSVNIYPRLHYVEVLWNFRGETQRYTCTTLFGNLQGNYTGRIGNINISYVANETQEDLSVAPIECRTWCNDHSYSYAVCRRTGQPDCAASGETEADSSVHFSCARQQAAKCCCG